MSAAGLRAVLQRGLPDTLFGRLALLLASAVLVSHVLALTLMFELRPARGPHPAPPPPPGVHAMAAPPGAPGLHPGLLLDIGVRLGVLLLAAWVAARWLASPTDRLAAAAGELGRDIARAPLPEVGTRECRAASRVFNQMQARIQRQLQDRDRFVAAVSHDLRTPLTRLRLRAEALPDDAERARFVRDIAEMDAMIGATLDHLRGVASGEPEAPLDLAALLQSLADDHSDCGHAVRVTGQANPLPAQAGALRRCIDNLIGNAVRYGGGAEVTLTDEGAQVRIVVRDHGPGLPEAELGRVLEPFYRAEGSRSRQHGGVGLGLSIARDIAERHRGSLELRNAEGGGLLATLALPRS